MRLAGGEQLCLKAKTTKEKTPSQNLLNAVTLTYPVS